MALYLSKANREVNSLGRINGKQEAHINFQLYIMFRYMFWWINRVTKQKSTQGAERRRKCKINAKTVKLKKKVKVIYELI